jgi:hypothetical protein
MFQFRAYASSKGYPLRDGLPHSDTHGSTLLCSSPWLFAALHVLHRLCMPRHPPCALNHFNYKACTRSSSSLKNQNPEHILTVIRLIVASEILSDSQLPLAHIPRTLTGAQHTLRIYIVTTSLCQRTLQWSYGDSNPGPPACKAGALAS